MPLPPLFAAVFSYQQRDVHSKATGSPAREITSTNRTHFSREIATSSYNHGPKSPTPVGSPLDSCCSHRTNRPRTRQSARNKEGIDRLGVSIIVWHSTSLNNGATTTSAGPQSLLRVPVQPRQDADRHSRGPAKGHCKPHSKQSCSLKVGERGDKGEVGRPT